MIAVDPPVRILIFPLASEGPSTHACSRQDWPRCSDGRSRTATPAARRYRPLMALTLRICREFCPVTCGPGFAAIARQTSPGLAGSGAAMGYFVLDLNRRQISPVWCGRRSIGCRSQGPGRLHHRTLHAAQARFWAWGPALPLALVLVLAGCGPLLLAWVFR